MRDVPTLTDSYKQVTRRQLSCTAVKSFRWTSWLVFCSWLVSQLTGIASGWYCIWLVLQLDAKCQGVQETERHRCGYLRSRSFSAAWEKVVLRHSVACRGAEAAVEDSLWHGRERESAIQTWSLNTDGLGNSSIGRELKLRGGRVSVIPDWIWDID